MPSRKLLNGLLTVIAVASALPGLVEARDIPVAKNVVLVHGLYADGSSWIDVIPYLQRAGLNVTAVQNPLTSLADDVAATRRALASQDGGSDIPKAARERRSDSEGWLFLARRGGFPQGFRRRR
jgi:hypothetical protein